MRKVIVANAQVREVDALFTELEDCREGCLLDSYIGWTTDSSNLVAVIERYETCWTSGYTVYIADTQEQENEVWEVWENFCKDYDEQFGTED